MARGLYSGMVIPISLFKLLCKGSYALENFCDELSQSNSVFVDAKIYSKMVIFKKQQHKTQFCITSRSVEDEGVQKVAFEVIFHILNAFITYIYKEKLQVSCVCECDAPEKTNVACDFSKNS